ncbi:MAG TPA: hypothetical protein VNC50_01010 [Planctomycetia bacterium]|nr:hypothetical protein [Planctomycetia bacterium]
MSRVLVAAPVLACLAGCASLPSAPSLSDPMAVFRKAPVKMVVNLSQTHLEKDSMPYHQGMVATVYFFDADERNSLAVDGDIHFVAYDKAKHGDEPKPVGEYDIPAAKLQTHKKKDLIGDTYTFWLPYEPEQKTTMVVVASHRPKRGVPMVSEPSSIALTPLKESKAVAEKSSAAAARRQFVMIDGSPFDNGPAVVATTIIPTRHSAADRQIVRADATTPAGQVPATNVAPVAGNAAGAAPLPPPQQLPPPGPAANVGPAAVAAPAAAPLAPILPPAASVPVAAANSEAPPPSTVAPSFPQIRRDLGSVAPPVVQPAPAAVPAQAGAAPGATWMGIVK